MGAAGALLKRNDRQLPHAGARAACVAPSLRSGGRSETCGG